MRILIGVDALGSCDSVTAGTAVGRAFRTASQGQAHIAVIPMAAGGTALQQALTKLGRPVTVVGGEPAAPFFNPHDSSWAVGQQLVDVLETESSSRLLLDLTGFSGGDGGAGLLAALGATASGARLDAGALGLVGLTGLDLSRPRAGLDGIELIGVLPSDQRYDELLGLRGWASRFGRQADADPQLMLSSNDGLAALLSAMGVADGPGVGAGGGLAAAVLALGGRLVTGPDLCAEASGLEHSVAQADLVITGADTLDFAARGGPVVAAMAEWAEASLKPCVAVAREVAISTRELRVHGIESAHAIGGDATMGAAELEQRAAGVASSWLW